MKITLIILTFLLGLQSLGQVFHVSDTSALIIKNTNQSPAHWYIEVFSDIATDTSLRWKATHFDNVPPEWEILMDDQSASYSNVQVGDSADFDLPANQPFARKLIIGAVLNGTPGHGICYFDIYDPDNLSFVQTISYEFIVTDQVSGMMELNDNSFLRYEDGFLKVKDGREANFVVYDLGGKIVFENKLINKLEVSCFPINQLYFIKVKIDDLESIVKIYNGL